MISVIVLVYRVELYLRQYVDSILNQTYRDLEVLLIDDGSPDRCGEICEYKRKDGRIRVFHTENCGLSAARNLGLRVASGEYIGFVDSDDWIEPEMYEVLLRKVNETCADIGVCGLWYDYLRCSETANGISDKTFFENEALSALVLDQLKNYAWNKLFRRELWEDVLFPEGHVFEDVATIFKTILKAKTVTCVSQAFYLYRQHMGSIGSTVTMNNLIDYWNAYYDMYVGVQDYFINEVEVKRKLMELVANGAAKTWRWVYRINKDQRNTEHINKVSLFVRKHFSVFGETEWRLYLRVTIFFARYVNSASLALCYYLNIGYKKIV